MGTSKANISYISLVFLSFERQVFIIMKMPKIVIDKYNTTVWPGQSPHH